MSLPRSGHIFWQSVPTNVSRTRNGGNAYLGRDNVLRSNRRPKKDVRRLDKLTFDSRMPGEPWRDDEDYGWSLRALQSAGIWGATRLTKSGNDAQVTPNLRIHKSQILFESDTFICKHILLDIAKYIHWLLLLSFLSITPLCLWGSVGVINRLLWYFYLLT